MTSSILAKLDGLELPAAADFHVHLRDGAMMETVVPLIRAGGVNTVYVMPNLVPPLTLASDAIAYKNRLQQLDPKVHFMMTLYLHDSITPAVVEDAKAQGIVGIKVYPAGVTTNSSSGVSSYEPYYPVFRAMEQHGMVLNLHGECPSDHAKNITILNAESTFLPTLKGLHEMFPKLRIVLEHCTTKEAVQAVNDCGPNVVGTITAHHLFLTVDDWADDPFCYCKPVAKWPTDREALIKAALAGTGKFFLGSDSAPHDIKAKKGGTGKTAAGVFTQPYVLPLVIDAFEQAIARKVITEDEVTVDILKGFLSSYGRMFYKLSSEIDDETVIIKRGTEIIQGSFTGHGVEVFPASNAH
ncbi:dihydroorotase [Diplocarpon rosae]|nr:dihydroorotase [Diplocarpon rosae]